MELYPVIPNTEGESTEFSISSNSFFSELLICPNFFNFSVIGAPLQLTTAF